jgi:sarcosine oxidase subunit gamma
MPTLPPESLLAGRRAEAAGATLDEVALPPLHWIAPYPGREGAAGEVLGAALGLPFPAPGATARAEGAEIRWAGRAQAFLVGPAAAPEGLAGEAAVVDVSDVHTALRLAGPAAPEILARLVPLDLRHARFPPGRAARTMLGHMNAHLTADEDGLEILVMRSFARTAFHEIEVAMERVAARAALVRPGAPAEAAPAP